MTHCFTVLFPPFLRHPVLCVLGGLKLRSGTFTQKSIVHKQIDAEPGDTIDVRFDGN